MTAQYYSLNSKNTNSYSLQYKKSTATSYSTQSVTLTSSTSSGITTLTGSTIIAADSTSSYDYLFTVNDYFTSSNATKSIGTIFTLLHYDSSGKGACYGSRYNSDNGGVLQVGGYKVLGFKVEGTWE